MKTKAEIIQRLLDEDRIDAEEAVILLMADKQIQFIPYPQPYPVYPIYPLTPYYRDSTAPFFINTHPQITVSN